MAVKLPTGRIGCSAGRDGSGTMGRKSSEKQARRTRQPTSKEKGDLVERIVASMHERSDIIVEKNVFLPAAGGAGRRREIDVLLSSTVAGYPVRFAIECKNEARATGAPDIDKFVGKLDDVNISRQYGIYVVTSGYTKGAVDRAQQAGIKTLILSGLSQDRLASAISEAMQSVVHCLLVVQQIVIQNNVPRAQVPEELHCLYDDEGRLRLTIPDLI